MAVQFSCSRSTIPSQEPLINRRYVKVKISGLAKLFWGLPRAESNYKCLVLLLGSKPASWPRM
eukprot:scaffold19335_cov15-Prasinocladus_malaysianus.AAC.1